MGAIGNKGGGGVVGSGVPPGPGRVLAAAAHGNLAGPLLLALLAVVGGNAGDAPGMVLVLSFLWTLADAVAWFLSRRMGSAAASHASQAFWVAVPAFVAFVACIVVSGPALGFVALALFALFGVLGVVRVVRGEGHRYPGVAILMEGRRQ